MKRNVLLTISGHHREGETNDGNVETMVGAEYYKRNDTHYLLYEEREEGFEQVSKNRIKFRKDMLELNRQGLLHTHMIFEQGKKHITSYQTPYGQMMLAVDTHKISIEEQEKEIQIAAEYTLEADGEYLSDSKILICIREQE